MRKHIPIQFIMRINFDRFKVILSSISYSIVSFNQRTVERFSSLFLVFNSNFIFLSCLPVFQKLSRSRNHPLAPYFAFALSLSVSLSAEKSVEYLRATYQTIEIDISFSFFSFQLDHLQSTDTRQQWYFVRALHILVRSFWIGLRAPRSNCATNIFPFNVWSFPLR